MLVSLFMGFSCGLPLLLTITVLQAWMKEERVDLGRIGLIALVGLPYTAKFLWAPFLDRITLPFLGRRRGWLLVAQVSLALAIVVLSRSRPAQAPWLMSLAALFVAFFSASQDIVVDAYRREDLADSELGLGSALYVNGYRLGMLLASGPGLIMADHMPFSRVYLIMAACMIPGIATTLLAHEPKVAAKPPRTMREAVFEPLSEYFSRKDAVWILLFILFYKLGDTMASAMTTPFYLDIGFTKSDIGIVVKLFGFWASLGGSLLGGIFMVRLGIKKSLWIFGLLQAAALVGFPILYWSGPASPVLSGVTAGHGMIAMTIRMVSPPVALLAVIISMENLCFGMGTSAYAAFMASITDKRFTATQYALLSSLMGIPRVLVAAPTGFMAEVTGWPVFFFTCMAATIPGLLLLLKFTLAQSEETP